MLRSCTAARGIGRSDRFRFSPEGYGGTAAAEPVPVHATRRRQIDRGSGDHGVDITIGVDLASVVRRGRCRVVCHRPQQRRLRDQPFQGRDLVGQSRFDPAEGERR
jgi:hypothetical protein